MSAAATEARERGWNWARAVVRALGAAAGLALAAMVLIVCTDVVLREIGRLCGFVLRHIGDPAAGAAGRGAFASLLARCRNAHVPGAYDLVGAAGAVTIGCALPLTTAVKGHIAIEFLFQRMGRRSRVVSDTIVRLAVMGILALAAWQCARYGYRLLRSGEVTPTLQMPIFWIYWVIGFSCAVTILVKIYHIFHPGREMIKP